MKILRERVKIYLWLSVAYLVLMLFIDLIKNQDTFWERRVNHVWLISYLIVFNFILFEYTLPFIKLTWKRILLVPLLIWIHLMMYSFGFYAWRHIGIQLHIYFELKTIPSILKGVAYYVPYSFSSILFFGILIHDYDYRKLKQAALQLRIEKQEAELNYLKAQINPHFLFNTLNNIYALAKDKSDLTAESIMRLSKILRYMLYETKGDFTTLEQEIKIIHDYIALEKLRYDASLCIDFQQNIENQQQRIPPLLLMSLIENAFKHGVSETRAQPFINIFLSADAKTLVFTVKNSMEKSPDTEGGITEGIGLSNLRRQLGLLYTDYELIAQQGVSEFSTQLKINLKSHV